MEKGVQQRAVGVFAKSSDVELAFSELKVAKFPMDKVSVVARNAEQEDEIVGVEVREHIGNQADEAALAGAITGSTLGDLSSSLVGLGLLAVPGVGPIMFAGAEATAIATALAGGAVGAAAGSLGGALIGLGIPEEEAKLYSDLVSKSFYYLVIVSGAEEIHIAEKILSQFGIQRWGVYKVSTPLAYRYKNAAGIFYECQYAEQALTELKEAGYPTSQVSLFIQERLFDESLSNVNVISNDDLTNLGMPDEIAKHYKSCLTPGSYLVVLSGTDIQIAAAKTILKANKVENFHIYVPLVVNTVINNYQLISKKR
ncbi:hypothetical protein A6770_22365 [Nostoc minutum NIES-26]|uniref:Histidine kinase n=1 Tax=Nostoc minutum NIES-26 TaxID=1844469 RepID=A0A367QZ90_9NOSO|nr:hypothetical protein A6770_22365 [Nostoc minutum NIES-26]